MCVHQPELDYVSRLVLTEIDLNSDFPRDLLKSWMKTGSRYSLCMFEFRIARELTSRCSSFCLGMTSQEYLF